jgi:hypothetical protein
MINLRISQRLKPFTAAAMAAGLSALALSPLSAAEFKHQHIEPAKLVVGWDQQQGENYVPASVAEKLKPGNRVAVPDFAEPGKWYVQRLTDRTFWMICNAFASTVFVGDEGVLVVDASSSVNPADMLAAIKTFTDLPVKALVYSHAHTDHNGGAHRLQEALKSQGIDLRIIASESAAREIKIHKNNVAAPNEVLADGRSTFKFETFEFVLGTPVISAHSVADSYVLTPDGVIMYVDFNYPGRLPLGYISSSQNITGWINFLRHVLGEEWTYANLGHANVGYKRDIEQTFSYLSDLYDAYEEEVFPVWVTGEPFGKEIQRNGSGITAGVFWSNYVDEAAQIMAAKVYPKWKHVAHSEVIRSHAYKVFEDAFLNYNAELKAFKPDFDPIKPAQ